MKISMYVIGSETVKEIEPLIQSRGATVLYQSHYSPDFNPIENWWSQLKAFLRSFSPTSAWYSATALDLINPHHLKTGLPTSELTARKN